MTTIADKKTSIVELLAKHVKNLLLEEESCKLTGCINESSEMQQVLDEFSDEKSLLKALKELYEFERSNRFPTGLQHNTD